MEPKTQVEIQLGHMCNNRCVFCVSGQQTAFGRARPLPFEPLLTSVREAYAKGHRKLTLLGGEPTLQPAFKDVVAEAVQLGFEEVVIFTNGVKTAREAFLEEILALAPRRGFFTWRISIQGANQRSHEGTTRKPGSFTRILRTMDSLKARGERITVNMCVVGSNFASVDEFPALISRYGVKQLHLDMVRPMDAGERTDEEFAEMMPNYREMVPPLTRLCRGVPAEFDLNIGNFPFCFAPELAPWIHHDGEATETIAVDGEQDLSRPWNKYFVKRRDKFKPPQCAQCAFEPRCSGIFQKYAELHGTDEVVAVPTERLPSLDPGRRVFWAHLTDVARHLSSLRDGDEQPMVWLFGDNELRVRWALPQGNGELLLALRPPGGGVASTDVFSLHVLELPADYEVAQRLLERVWECASESQRVLYPCGQDALSRVSRLLGARLTRLRAAAPFSGLMWVATRIVGTTRAEVSFRADDGGEALLWLDEADGRATGGYQLRGAPTPNLRDGLREVLGCLSARQAREPTPLKVAP
ncbi:MAG: radical SAM protein [Polyangiaceae bacterium]|nr:radical SAM protein [Myxococcales bacterium]MCB9590868.1 radical SAM protein [Polyangiaceae bacterium]